MPAFVNMQVSDTFIDSLITGESCRIKGRLVEGILFGRSNEYVDLCNGMLVGHGRYSRHYAGRKEGLR